MKCSLQFLTEKLVSHPYLNVNTARTSSDLEICGATFATNEIILEACVDVLLKELNCFTTLSLFPFSQVEKLVGCDKFPIRDDDVEG